MHRSLSIVLFASLACCSVGRAQEVISVHHRQAVLKAAPCAMCGKEGCTTCTTGPCTSCGQCNDCVRITDTKKTKTPVYSCKIKEICVPNCNPFCCLFGRKPECKKIEVRQLVKSYQTKEECVSKCVTAEDAAKRAVTIEPPIKKASMEMPRGTPQALPPAPAIPQHAPQPFLGIEAPASYAPATTPPTNRRP